MEGFAACLLPLLSEVSPAKPPQILSPRGGPHSAVYLSLLPLWSLPNLSASLLSAQSSAHVVQDLNPEHLCST